LVLLTEEFWSILPRGSVRLQNPRHTNDNVEIWPTLAGYVTEKTKGPRMNTNEREWWGFYLRAFAFICGPSLLHYNVRLKPTPQRVSRPKTAAERQARVKEILARLDGMYPNATCALHHRNPFELLIATILSAQCTDKRVNEVTPGLFEKYPTPLDFASVRQEVLANDIRSTGFFNNKAKSIIGAAKKVVNDFGGQVPRTMEEMLTIPGAARKTANVVLGTAYKIASGVVVDTHVQRIAARLDLSKAADPVKIEQDLMKIIPRDRWILFSHQIILHGRALCVARKPKCAECGLRSLCYAKDKTV
jgi:endonuclease-3